MQSKKAIMGVGTLIILIAMILVSAIAAGVVINSAGSLQSKASIVADTVEKRLTVGIEPVAIYGYADLENQSLYGLEILARLKPASPPLNFHDISFILISDNISIGPTYVETKPCTFANINPETQYCNVVLLGNNDTVISQEELHLLKFKLSDSNRLKTNDLFELDIMTPKGDIVKLERRVPSLSGTRRISIR